MSYEPDEEDLKFYMRVVCLGLVENRVVEDPKEREKALDEMVEWALCTPTARFMRAFYREDGRYPDNAEAGKPVLTDGLEEEIRDSRIYCRVREVIWMGAGSPEILDPEGATPVLEELMELSRGTRSEELWKQLYAQLDQWKRLPQDKFIPSDEEMKAKTRDLATMRIWELKVDQPKVRERIIDEMVEQLKKPPFRLEKSLKRYYASHGKFPDFVKF